MESYLPSQQTPSPPSTFPSTYKCIFLLPSQQNSLKDSIITVSSHSTSATLTSLPLSCNYFCQGHQWPPSCKIQWSILCLHLTWCPSSIWYSGLLSPWNIFYPWFPGHHNLLVLFLPHWLLLINKYSLNKWILNIMIIKN